MSYFLLFSLDNYPGVELLDYMVVLFSVFWGVSTLFSKGATPIYIPTNSSWGRPFLHILTNACYVCLLILAAPVGVKCYLLRFWFSFSIWASDVELLLYLLAIYVSSLEKCVFTFFVFKLGCLYWVVGVIYILYV